MSTPEFETMSVEELEGALRYHNWKYWVENAPEITDYQYDKLVETLRERKPESPVLDAIGEAGAGLDGESHELGEKVEHRRSMLSLDKCYDDDTLNKWFEKFEGDAIVTPKIDGVAASIRYDASGRLHLAARRGNGRVGELITNNVRHVSDVPSHLPVGPLEVRGELYMPLSVFREHFAADFANPRNLTAGAIKQKVAEKTGGYMIRFMAYDLDPDGAVQPASEQEKATLLKSYGFQPVEAIVADREDASGAYRTLLAQRDHFDYETDGVVYKADRLDEQERLGTTAHHPRYAIAYKFQGDSAESTLREVEWSVSRTGAINPVAIVDPVVLSGATVTRASLHNLGIMAKLGGEKGLTVGSRVLMMRRGGVIPHVEQVIEAGDALVELPAVCPSCGGSCYREEDILLAEHTTSCSATRLGGLQHFVQVIEVKGFGPKLIQQLIEADLLQDPAGFYELTVEKMLSLERVGTKTAEKLVERVAAKNELPLDRLLCALGIDELGPVVARSIAAHFQNLERLKTATEEEIATIKGVGQVIANNVVTGLADRADLIERLLQHVTPLAVAAPAEAPEGPLTGSSFLFTGTLETMKRKEAQERVRALGGATPSSVVNSLTHLVLGDGDLAKFEGGWRSSKLKKVDKLNAEDAAIEVIGETQFLAMLEQ